MKLRGSKTDQVYKPRKKWGIRRKSLNIFYSFLYNELAWSYDLVAALVSAGLWKEWIFSVIPDINGPRVLELGHGPGHLQCKLAQKHIQIFGLDISRHMGVQAYKLLKKNYITPKLINGNTQLLPFPNNCFDQIVATFPSDFIVDPFTLSEVSRVLKHGGELIAIPLAHMTGKRLVDRSAGYLLNITEQATDFDKQYVQPFINLGFNTLLEIRKVYSSEVVIITAQKN